MPDYNNSICIEDFCGCTEAGHFHIEYWADYFPDLLTTYFGGEWSDIPPLHTMTPPDQEILNHWVNYHLAML